VARIKVALVCPYSLTEHGGVQGQVLGLARALRTLGVDAQVMGPCDDPPPDIGVVPLGRSLPMSANGSVVPFAPDPSAVLRTWRALLAEDADVLHLHEPGAPAVGIAALFTCAPVVATFHASGHRFYEIWGKLSRPLARRLTVRTAVSEVAARCAADAMRGDYEVLFNGVEVERFEKADPWPSDRPAILFAGRHEDRKGLRVLLDAFADLRRDAVLWVVGQGPQTDELAARDLPDVEWLGRVDDDELASRMRGAAAFCAPSLHSESFGVVLLEAMAAGTPVVCTTIDGYREVARHGVEAVGVGPGDVTGLRDALRQVLDDEALVADLVDAGSRRASELSMPRLAERYCEVYEQAVRIGGPRFGLGRR
jgi:phosphatidyl-myo-inositol alpha-mannosyltransferase